MTSVSELGKSLFNVIVIVSSSHSYIMHISHIKDLLSAIAYLFLIETLCQLDLLFLPFPVYFRA